MVDEASERIGPVASSRATRPELLIALIIAGEVAAMLLGWAAFQLVRNVLQWTNPSPAVWTGLSMFQVLSQGMAISAWWLAMRVPHNRRSIVVPLALITSRVLLHSLLAARVGIPYSFPNFQSWIEFSDGLWRWLALSTSSITLQLVCIGVPCYLLSRMTNIQLIRAGDVPQRMTFDIKRMFGATLLVAIAFAASRWADTSQTGGFTSELTHQDLTAIIALNFMSTGICWACLSWAYSVRSRWTLLVTLAGLMLWHIAMGILSQWSWANFLHLSTANVAELNWPMAVSYSLVSNLAILLAIHIADHCGFRLQSQPTLQ